MKRTWKTRTITPFMNGKQTKTYKKLKAYKIKIWALTIVSLYTFLATAKAYDLAKGNQLEPLTEVAQAQTEPSMQDWVLEEVKNAGINPYEAYMIVNCESRWNDQATNVNSDKYQSVDNGLWMINAYWHKEVSKSCAYDYKCATKEAIRIYKESNSWQQWNCAKIVGL